MRGRSGGLLMMTSSVVALVLLSGCGSGASAPETAGRAPERATTSTTLAPVAGPTGQPTPSVPAERTDVIVYFARGDQIGRFSRSVPRVPRIGAEAVKALLAGPTAEELRSGTTTAIPAGTEFRDLVIDNGIARVDLARTFESGGGSLSLTLRLAQVTCTLDEFASVAGVRFALDGQLVDVLSGQGVVVDQPVSCATYAQYVASSPPGGPTRAAFVGIWPFTSQAEVDAYLASGDQTFRDTTRTAREFAVRYLGMDDPVTFPPEVRDRAVAVPVGFRFGEGRTPIANPQPTMFVRLQGFADGDRGPWTVIGADSPQVVVDVPAALATVSSPVTLTGRATAFEGHVEVQVREDGMLAGQSLVKGFVTGRGDGVLGPFRGDVAFRTPSKPSGAVVFVDRSAADGQVLRATVVRVGF